MSVHGLDRCPELESCRMWRILEVTRKLATPIGLDEMLQQVADAAVSVLEADRCTIFLYDTRTDELYSKNPTDAGEIRFPANAGIAGETAQKRQMINVPDCYADPRFNRDIDRKTGYYTRCLLSVPLIGIDDKLVGVLEVLNKREGVFQQIDENLARTMAAQVAVVLQREMLLEERIVKEKLKHDLVLAREIQRRALPQLLPQLNGYQLAVWLGSAEETAGDIYDAVSLDENRIGLLLGDATGHGVGAALSVTEVRAMFRMGLRLGSDLDSLFTQVNDQLADDLPSNRFVTAFIGFLDSIEHKLFYHSGGQAPLLHYHAERNEIEWLEASSLPMGILKGLQVEAPPPLVMKPADIVGLITDGVYERHNPGGDEFGRERVAQLILQNRDSSPQQLIASLLGAVDRFAEATPQEDDITIVLIKREG